jgi:hypothetical protein
LVPLAATAAEPKKDDEAALIGQAAPPKFNEIERGLWFSIEAAPIAHLDWISTLPPTRLPRQLLPDDAGFGFRSGGRVGYDIMNLVSVEGYLVAQAREKRIRTGRAFSGDLTDFTVGGAVSLMPITIRDRLSLTGRVGLGLAALFPGETAQANANPNCIPNLSPVTSFNPMCLALPGVKVPSNPLGFQPFPAKVFAASPTAEVMLGVEYFTHLRHFSVGANVMGGVMFWPFQLHTGVVPHVKYSF